MLTIYLKSQIDAHNLPKVTDRRLYSCGGNSLVKDDPILYYDLSIYNDLVYQFYYKNDL